MRRAGISCDVKTWSLTLRDCRLAPSADFYLEGDGADCAIAGLDNAASPMTATISHNALFILPSPLRRICKEDTN